MKKRSIFLSLVILGCFITSMVSAEEKIHWGYSGQEGPEHWGTLSPEYSFCSEGNNQSPVNLTGMIESDLSPFDISYQPAGNEIINNGHAIEVKYAPGSTITVNEHEFALLQFHFHSPSENTIEGQSYPLEAHFVHADKDGNLAVISVLYTIGEKHAELEVAWAHMPDNAGEKSDLRQNIDANLLLPQDHDYYRFNGSLTTPPCSEGVLWLVMKENPTVSEGQIKKFTRIMGHPNNRPVQPLNARVIMK